MYCMCGAEIPDKFADVGLCGICQINQSGQFPGTHGLSSDKPDASSPDPATALEATLKDLTSGKGKEGLTDKEAAWIKAVHKRDFDHGAFVQSQQRRDPVIAAQRERISQMTQDDLGDFQKKQRFTREYLDRQDSGFQRAKQDAGQGAPNKMVDVTP